MDNYLRALDINVVLRKVVCLLKPDKEIIHTGDHMVIRTITSLRDYVMDFDLGVQFEEDLGPVDGRKCQTTVFWEGDQLVCEQLGEKRNRGWRHWGVRVWCRHQRDEPGSSSLWRRTRSWRGRLWKSY